MCQGPSGHRRSGGPTAGRSVAAGKDSRARARAREHPAGTWTGARARAGRRGASGTEASSERPAPAAGAAPGRSAARPNRTPRPSNAVGDNGGGGEKCARRFGTGRQGPGSSRLRPTECGWPSPVRAVAAFQRPGRGRAERPEPHLCGHPGGQSGHPGGRATWALDMEKWIHILRVP